MRKLLLILLFVRLAVLSQTTIPKPSEVSVNESIFQTEIIGDFDGDFSNEIAVWWVESNVRNPHFSVYSFKKNTHLLVIESTGYPFGSKEAFVGDLDHDGTVEIVILDKIYSFAGTGIKKKVQ